MVDEKCPSCGNSLKFVGKSEDNTAHGHRARKFKCTNKNCPRETVYGGWANE